MTITKHELRQGRNAFLIWTVSIAFLLAICIIIFPEMKGEMAGVSKIFSAMGAFTAAFGMDRLDFGSIFLRNRSVLADLYKSHLGQTQFSILQTDISVHYIR